MPMLRTAPSAAACGEQVVVHVERDLRPRLDLEHERRDASQSSHCASSSDISGCRVRAEVGSLHRARSAPRGHDAPGLGQGMAEVGGPGVARRSPFERVPTHDPDDR
jgi:hypothetical protein